MRRLLAPLTARVGERMAAQPGGARSGAGSPAPRPACCSATSRSACSASTTCSSSTTTPRADAVYYVGGNVLALEKRFAFRPRDFRLWIAIHEVTHRAQFTGVPWMKPYYLSLVESDAVVDRSRSAPRSCRRCARAADEFRNGRNPLDDGGLVALLASDEQRGALAQVQALMSLLEGHGNA